MWHGQNFVLQNTSMDYFWAQYISHLQGMCKIIYVNSMKNIAMFQFG